MQLSAIIEAFLIASDEPLPTAELARLIRVRIAELKDEHAAAAAEEGDEYVAPADLEDLSPELLALENTDEDDILSAISELNRSYESSGRSFLALERAKGWKIYTTPAYGGFVKHLFPEQKPKRLSAPAMETLAIVAYRQPVTKAAIDAVRGVASDGMLQKLLDLELVKIVGRAELPGRPLLYATTEYFFEHFGIKSPDELPNAGELRRMQLPEPEPESEGDSAEGEAKQMPLADAPNEPPASPDDPGEDFATPDAENSESAEATHS